ncbi:unnamed protein product [Rangifer tarandus platyrhynchus]|uniref:Uncharacterized protein n=1 Tax=Rangifer tarandus platyrhynchus TaxID=3082113 RepID=A0AC59YJK3_RANTA
MRRPLKSLRHTCLPPRPPQTQFHFPNPKSAVTFHTQTQATPDGTWTHSSLLTVLLPVRWRGSSVWECAVGSSTNRHNKSNAAPLSARLVSYGSHSRVFGCRQRSPATPAERPPDEAPTPRGERGATGPGLLTTHTGAPAPPPQSHHTVLQPGHSSGRSSLRTVPTPRLTSLVSAGKLAQLLAKFSPKNVT